MAARISTSLRVLAGVFLAASGGVLFADVIGFGVVSDYRIDGFRKVVIVGLEYMSLPSLQHVLSQGEAANTRMVSAFANREDAALIVAGKGHTEVTYADWEAMYRADRRRQQFRMMRLIEVGGDAVLQVVDAGRISRTVLKGVDPTQFSAGGRTCELLDLYWYRLPRSIRSDGLNPLKVDAYVRTDSLPTDAEAASITHALQKRLQYPEIAVNIRTDTWFIEDSRFPIWFPFADTQPPSFQQYRSRGQIFCTANASEVRCRGSMPN